MSIPKKYITSLTDSIARTAAKDFFAEAVTHYLKKKNGDGLKEKIAHEQFLKDFEYFYDETIIP